MTSFAVIIGLLVFVWKRSSDQSSSNLVKPVEVPKFSSSNKDEDDEGLFFPFSPLLCLVVSPAQIQQKEAVLAAPANRS
nr:hypothetical protein CFP56_77249 [Quercus suber]